MYVGNGREMSKKLERGDLGPLGHFLQEILVKRNVVQSLLPAHSVKENAIMGYLEKKFILRTVFKNSRSLKLWKTKVEKKISVFKISGYYVDGALVNEDFF